MNGYQKMEAFYSSYLSIFKSHPDFYKFLSEFDVYMSNEKNSDLDSYEKAIEQYEESFLAAYEEGLKDGSIKKQDNIKMFYFSTTHSVLELCKKLSLKGILSQDFNIEKNAEVKCLISIILSALKK